MAISLFEKNYMTCLFDINLNGTQYKITTSSGEVIQVKRVPHLVLPIDCANDTPFLKSREVKWEDFMKLAKPMMKGNAKWLCQMLKDRGSASLHGQVEGEPDIVGESWSLIDGKVNATVLIERIDVLKNAVEDIMAYFMMIHTVAETLGESPGILTYVVEDAYVEAQSQKFAALNRQYSYLLSINVLRNEGYEIDNFQHYTEALEDIISISEKKIAEIIAQGDEATRSKNAQALLESYQVDKTRFTSILNAVKSSEKDLGNLVDIVDSTPVFHRIEGLPVGKIEFGVDNYLHMPAIDMN